MENFCRRGGAETGIVKITIRIEVENGVVRQSNFHDYKMLRMAETPEISVYIIESIESPGGVGEPGTPPIAPAVANAIFAATGRRLRQLPLRL